MPEGQGIRVVGVPALHGPLGVAENGEAIVRVHSDLLEFRITQVDARHDAVDPIPVIHLGVAVVRAGFLLKSQRGGVRVVAVARILTRAVGPDEPLARLGELDLVLVEFDVAQREPVVPLIDRRAESAVESIHQLGRLIGFLRLEAQVQGGADLQVLRAVVNEVDFPIACPIEAAESPSIGTVVSTVVEDGTVLVPIDVHGVEAAGIAQPVIGQVHGVVVVRHPVVRTEAEGVDLESEHGIAVRILHVVGVPETGLGQVALTSLGAHADPRKAEGRLGLHGHHPVEGAGTVERAARSGHDVHLHDVQLRSTEEVAEGEVESGTLVVHPIDELQGTHGRRTVEAAGVDDFESQGGTRQVDSLEVAQALVKIAARRFLDGEHIHALDGEWPLLLALIDAGSHHLSLLHEDGIGLEHGTHFILGIAHVDGQGGVANEAHVQPHRKGGHFQTEPTIEIGAGARVAPLDQNARREHRISCLPVNDLTADDRLGIHSGEGTKHEEQQGQKAIGRAAHGRANLRWCPQHTSGKGGNMRRNPVAQAETMSTRN